MKKILISSVVIFAVLLISTSVYAFFGKKEAGSVNADVRNFSHLSKVKPVKTVNYYCSFQKIVDGEFLKTGDFCETPERKNLDYVSYFISFDYQNILLRSNDFILNLAYFIDNKDKNKFTSFLTSYTSKGIEGVKSEIFDNATPTSFVATYNGNTRFFISKKDLFLRDTIYPSYKLTGLILPEQKDKKFLADYKLKYTVFPFTMTMQYEANWVSQITGAPMYEIAERFVENHQGSYLTDYFKRIDEFVMNQSLKYYNFADENFNTAASVYPYLFEKQIKGLMDKKEDKIIPSLPKENEGYIFDYLPSYKLDKVDIVVINDQTKVETVLKSFTASDFAEVYINNDREAGLIFDTFKLKNATYQIRFTHTAQSPKYTDAGSVRMEGAGLGYIFSSLGYTIVTNLNVIEDYNVKTLPVACLKTENIAKNLGGLNMPEAEIKKILSVFNNVAEGCTEVQALTTGMITEIKK